MSDLSSAERAPAVSFGVDRRLTALSAALALIALALAVNADDRPGRLLFGLATAILLAYAAGDLIFHPRLRADRSGIRIRTPMSRADLDWDDVEDVRADVRSRLGLSSSTLEIDAGATLVVFSRRALGGAEPADVRELVLAMDPRGR